MSIPSYTMKSVPYAHQRDEFNNTKDLPAWARFWEMGTGKTFTTIEEACHLFVNQRINGLFVVAPNGVHRNWVVEEIPRHLPDELFKRCRMHWYSGHRNQTLDHQRSMKRLMATPQEDLAVLTMSYDSMMTEHGRAAAKAFLMDRHCMYVLDESRRIKEPSAKRTKRVLASGPYAKYRRILNGTPVSNGPFDVYSQIQFLDPTFWAKKGISTYAGFKNMFANYKPIKGPGGRSIMVVDYYKNLPVLERYLKEISSRVTKDDVLDLPEKTYSRMTFEMSSEQQRIYDAIKSDFIAILENSSMVSAPLAITRLLRLQQVTCGYVMNDDGVMYDIGKSNPRLEILETMCEDLPHQAIIWSRFTRGIDQICDMLGKEAVRYDGSTTEEDRGKAIKAFQAGDVKYFVGNQQAAGEGITLTAARTVFRWANCFDLAATLQSDDRAHRIGQEHPVNYVDFIASGTVDVRICDCLQNKKSIADEITGDNKRSWIE